MAAGSTRGAARALAGWAGAAGGHGGGMARARLLAWRERLAAMGAEEARQRRLFLWTPVFFGAGVLVYYAADREPPLWPALVGVVLAALGAARSLRLDATGTARAFLAAAFLFAGFAAAALRTVVVEAPVIERLINARVTAYVEVVDQRAQNARLLLRVVSVEGLAPGAAPARVRVTIRGRPAFAAGATITAVMRLSPPPRASEPGGYDFSRDAFYQRIGAVGSVVSRPQIAPDAAQPWTTQVTAWIDRGRNTLTDRIIAAIGGADGAVAAALITGKRGMIPEETNEALRAAGIYHVVSISGLHMVLAAGLFMWSLRLLLAASPTIALRRPIKKWAAGFAMVGSTAYYLFSGSEVATERSLVMMLVLLGAVLVDRPAISMRNLAVAALIVLAREPSTLLGPSFQMSFAAVAAMIAAFERTPGAKKEPEAPPGLLSRLRGVVAVMLVTTLVAALATDPFATFHFHRVTVYGLVGNALTLPLVEFVVMPAAVFGVLASAFGLDAPVWWVMGQGVGLMMEVARHVAVLPGAVRMAPAFGVGALLMMTLALLWLTLWTTRLRWFGIVFAVAGVGLAVTARAPDVMLDARGETLAYRAADGRLVALNAKANPFGVAQWLAGDADPRGPRDPTLLGDARCDASGCVGRMADGRVIALTLERSALPTDCDRADVLVTRHFTRGACLGPALVLDGAHFEKAGATHLWRAAEGGYRISPARRPGLDRPWSRAPKAPVTPGGAPDGARWTPEDAEQENRWAAAPD